MWRDFGVRLLLLCGLCLLTNEATAADPNQIIGQWIERFANGNGIVTEFAADTISSRPVDAAGKSLPSSSLPPPMKVTYKDLGHDAVGIDFGGGGGIMVFIKGPNTIVLDFPGMGAHLLTRLT